MFAILVPICVVLFIIRYFYVPLPMIDVADRRRMEIVEVLTRLFILYPVRILSNLGFMRGRLLYLRASLWCFALPQNLCAKYLWSRGIVTRDVRFSTVPVRVYLASGRKANGPAIVLFHGGGFTTSSVESHDFLARYFAEQLNWVVVSVQYRLAPEHIFPAAVNDAIESVIHFLSVAYADYEVDRNRVVLCGDSAGGTLATVVAQKLRHKPELPPIKAQILFHPLVHLHDYLSPAYQQNQLIYEKTGAWLILDRINVAVSILLYTGIGDNEKNIDQLMFNKHLSERVQKSAYMSIVDNWRQLPASFRKPEFMQRDRKQTYWDPYTFSKMRGDSRDCNDEKLQRQFEKFLLDPDFAPAIQQDLSRMPKTYLTTGGYDLLRDEGYLYAQRLKAAGNDVTYVHYEDAVHGFFQFYPLGLRRAAEALEEVVQYMLINV